MLTYATYKLVHTLALSMVLVSLGALIVGPSSKLSKRTIAITHGVGLLLLLVSGFGLLAKLQIHSVPGWVGAKLVFWLLLGGYMALVPRLRSKHTALLWWSLPVVTVMAAYMALTKPF
jgi:uncharacterized membrane protein SirB2